MCVLSDIRVVEGVLLWVIYEFRQVNVGVELNLLMFVVDASGDHTKHTHARRVQNTTLYSDGTTHTK